MACSLKAGKVEYSNSERQIFTILSKRRQPISSDDLLTAFWRNRAKPYQWRIAGMGTLRSLRKKMTFNGEACRIKTSRTRPQSIWLEDAA